MEDIIVEEMMFSGENCFWVGFQLVMDSIVMSLFAFFGREKP